MPHVDHITLVDTFLTTVSAVFEVLGRVTMLREIYPDGSKSYLTVAVSKADGGTATIRIWDYVGARSLGTLEINDSSWVGKKLTLSDLPTANEDGVALIEFQMKTDGTGTGRCIAAAMEVN